MDLPNGNVRIISQEEGSQLVRGNERLLTPVHPRSRFALLVNTQHDEIRVRQSREKEPRGRRKSFTARPSLFRYHQ